MEYVTLNNGVKMPKLGYGVYQTPPAETERCVREAIEVGYRSIDTAQPFSDYYGTYRAMEEAYRAGKVRAIGVSNFYPDRFLDIQHFSEIKPAVNQVETHVFQQQKVAKEYMKKNGTQIMSWGPFAEGKNDYFNNPVLKEIGAKYGKTVAQTALRFLLQSDVVIIPKSTHRERMEENFNLFDFTLSPEDMAKIETLDGGKSLFFSHYDPQTVEWFMTMA